MAEKSYEELRIEHNKVADEYNKALHTEPRDNAKIAKLKTEYKKLWKRMGELKKGGN
jgi:hypothetical protein